MPWLHLAWSLCGSLSNEIWSCLVIAKATERPGQPWQHFLWSLCGSLSNQIWLICLLWTPQEDQLSHDSTFLGFSVALSVTKCVLFWLMRTPQKDQEAMRALSLVSLWLFFKQLVFVKIQLVVVKSVKTPCKCYPPRVPFLECGHCGGVTFCRENYDFYAQNHENAKKPS